MSRHKKRWEKIRDEETKRLDGSIILEEKDYEWLMANSKTFGEMIKQFGLYDEENDDLSDFYHDFRRMFIFHYLDHKERLK